MVSAAKRACFFERENVGRLFHYAQKIGGA
jgi:hypothetical protein